MQSEHTDIGHERVHLTDTGEEDGFKSTLRFRVEFIKLKLELSNYSMMKIIAGNLRIDRHDARRPISITSWLC